MALLAIPYQKATLDDLVSKGKMVSDDRTVILGAMSAVGHLDYAGWQKLLPDARAYIRKETLRLLDTSFSGVTRSRFRLIPLYRFACSSAVMIF